MASSIQSMACNGLLCLQELARKPLVEVPLQFIQDSKEATAAYPHGGSSSEVPVVDLGNFREKGRRRENELRMLHKACREWGVLQVSKHGVREQVVERVKREIDGFYELPVEERLPYKIRTGEVEGYGQTIILREGQKVDWADRFYMMVKPTNRRRPHLLPELPPSFREGLEDYFDEVEKMAMDLLGLMAEAMEMEKRELVEMFEDGMQSVRINYYPPCPQPEKVVGLTPHSDATGITILLQLNPVDGLQVKKDGSWIPVHALPDSFIVILGDVLEIMSNGLYHSVEHRVTVNADSERTSIAMFFNPKFEVKIQPAPSLLSHQNPARFRSIGMEEYVKEFFSRKLNGKTFLELMKIKQSPN